MCEPVSWSLYSAVLESLRMVSTEIFSSSLTLSFSNATINFEAAYSFSLSICFCSRSPIWLNASARSPISSLDPTSNRNARSPFAILLVPFTRSRIGLLSIFANTTETRIAAIIPENNPIRDMFWLSLRT